MTKTNILPDHLEKFNAIRNPEYRNFALFSAFVDGKPTTAIVSVEQDGDEFLLTPLFVAVTPEMVITDHNGNPAKPYQEN